MAEPEVCSECQSVSRLTNGLCLNCLLRGALGEQTASSGREVFKEALAAVRSRNGDWQIADHEILDEIARGGMGVVYQAREPHSDRIVALKCVLAYQGDSDHAVARFRREAETAARLDHPNIVPIYQVGETADGFPYYTMKYALAGSLLQARGPLLQHPRQSVQLLLKVANAVQYAHEKGVLHRDLKPGNILLDERGEPLVSDFGLARCEANSSYLTRSLASFGTPGYIAPEQADGPAAQLTPAADIYSLGAILFELLTGRLPFVGENAFAVMKQSADNPAPKVRTFVPHVDRDLETICARCLEREPGDRYQSAAELAEDLERWLDDRPIAARRSNLWRHSRRWVRRNRWMAALVAAFCLLGVASLVWQIRASRLQSAMRATALSQRSVVVLPFLDLDNVARDSTESQAFAAFLQGQLEKFGPARVTPGSLRTWDAPEDVRIAGQESKARTVLTGTVRIVEGRKRFSVRLLDAANGDPLFVKIWEEGAEPEQPANETRQLSQNIYAVLSANDWSEIRQSKVDPGLRNDVAREAMIAGREWMTHYTVSDTDRAIALFERALSEEPNSALAHSYLASAVTTRTHYIADQRFLELGRAEANKALQLSPDLADAHRALAGVYLQEGKLREALEEQIRTLEIGGMEGIAMTSIGLILDSLGSPHQSLRWYKLASRLFKSPGDIEGPAGDAWTKLADDERALRAYNRKIELRPGSSDGVVGKCHLELVQSHFDSAREIIRTRLGTHNELGDLTAIAAQIEFFARNFPAAEELYRKLALGDPNGGGSFYGTVTYQSALGRIQQELGENEAATILLKDCLAAEAAMLARQPMNPDAAYRVAAVEACLNLSEKSYQHLRQAIDLGWLDYRSLLLDPRFDSLRSDPEFIRITGEISAKVAEMRLRAIKDN
ncbi:MAG TPA: protein kinase [Chthoniobacterales bacterium]|nr:protein kinase [Chthoniobacterales bacterium]